MKRQTLFILSLLFFSLSSLHAAVININTGTTDALRNALNSAADGDEIVMAAGTYVESNTNYIAFKGKSVTVRAAEGAEVILQPKVTVRLNEGATARFEGIKFDCSRLNESGSYSNVFVAADKNEANNFAFENCEFYNFTVNNSLIYCSSSNKLASVSINNCYFHNIMKSCLFIQDTAAIDISITNSTFANIETNTTAHHAGVIDSRATSGSFLVDHCTFYNVEAMNTDYAAIGKVGLTSGAVVSNCIFALSAPGASSNRTIRDKVAAKNCLVYNYTTDSNYGMQGNVTKTNCIIADPLFADAPNGDFSFNKASPAYFAGTNWSHIGDPKWFPTELEGIDLPAASADEAVTLNSANIEVKHPAVTCDGNGFYDLTYASDIRWVAWLVNVNPLFYDISAFVSCTTGWHPDLYLYDLTTGAEIASRVEEYHYPTEEGASFNLGGWDLTSVDAGKYLLVIKNNYSDSNLKLKSLTLSYLGGAVVPVAADANTTLDVADALFTEGFTRADGQVSPGSWKSSENPLGYVKWNIATTETKFYDLTLNFTSTNAHSMAVNIYEDENASPVASISESYTSTTGTLTIDGRVNLMGGKNYVVKVTNPTSGSLAKVTSVVFAPVAASSTALPNTLAFSNAVLSARAHITDGKLYFAPIGDTNPAGEWAQWAVTTDHSGLFLFTMNVDSDNSQSYKISIYDDGDALIDSCELKPSRGAQTVKHYFRLPAGSYSVKVENTTRWSHGHLISLVVTEPDDVLTIDETATDNSVIAAAKVAGGVRDVQIIRTLKGGVYNTICLPFAVSSEKTKEVFGADVKLLTLGQATLEDDGFAIVLEFDPATDIYQGTPLLIKPSRDIVNPMFIGVTVLLDEPSPTTKNNADFVGTFIKQDIAADENNLYLGTDDKLYFSRSVMPIKGMRAWFHIHGAPAGAVQRARIVESGNIVTELELVRDADVVNSQSTKIIENGQLYIIRDGIRYNALGQIVK